MNTTPNPKPIIITGGHHNSALALALELKSQGHKIIWLGHKFTQKGNKSISAEYQEVTASGIPFHELKTGKFYHVNPLSLIKVIFGFFQSLYYLLSFRPKLIIAFGGYLSVPVVIAAWLLRIPAVSHEQTVTAGWANKAISPFVKKIFLTHPSSLPNYPRGKSIVTGLPLRSQLLTIPPKKYPLPVIYITCGKQGSHIINKNLFPLIPELVTKYKVIHQTGASTLTKDQERARRLKKSLPLNLRSHYLHRPYFFAREAALYLKSAKLVIARAGAHTTYELQLLHKKAVLIPIPWVSHNEQLQNAQLLAAENSAIILQEKELTPQALRTAITKALTLKPKTSYSLPLDANAKIIKLITPYI